MVWMVSSNGRHNGEVISCRSVRYVVRGERPKGFDSKPGKLRPFLDDLIRARKQHKPLEPFTADIARWKPRKKKGGNGCLDEEKVRGIRRDYAAGMTFGAMGRKYGCSGAAARKVALRLTWQFVN